jgi:hypothetical protein
MQSCVESMAASGKRVSQKENKGSTEAIEKEWQVKEKANIDYQPQMAWRAWQHTCVTPK